MTYSSIPELLEGNTSAPAVRIRGDHLAFATLSTEDAEIPVRVGYDIDDYKEITLQAVHVDMPGELGPDIQASLSEEQLDELKHDVCLQVEWRKPYGFDSHTGEPLFRRAR